MTTELLPATRELGWTERVAAYLRLLRLRQWTKNGFVLAGVLFSGRFTDPGALLAAVVAFLLFSLVSSAGYIFNDIRDREEDRLHPLKRRRPLAAGTVGVGEARVLMGLLLLLALPAGFWFGTLFGLLLTIYFLWSLSYSLWLKKIVLIDLIAVAAGFVLRAAAGAVVVGVGISPWLLICTTLLALFLGLGKRRHELLLLEDGAGAHRAALDDYSPELLNQLLSSVTAATLVSYSIYTFTAGHGVYMMLTIPFVLFGLFRYLYLIYRRDLGGSPEEALLGDKQLLGNIILWVIAVLVILYVD
ncbi:MAG: decaprenyl-phosphate phosphoribosyltransferase [Firmicutes bacterium]|jgi:4-hydroxybenzoate polyprenyltransferase|nr:decaprenyl-phosphate phosphoribosyltransferase [Bacillota bacterium]